MHILVGFLRHQQPVVFPEVHGFGYNVTTEKEAYAPCGRFRRAMKCDRYRFSEDREEPDRKVSLSRGVLEDRGVVHRAV